MPDVLDGVILELDQRIKELEKRGRSDIRKYNGEDRYIVKTAILFHLFHRFSDQFEDLIIKQAKSGDTACVVTFAGDILSSLTRYGFSDIEILRYLAGFYQLRRAFFFIREGLLGQCSSMRRLREDLWNNVFTHDTRLYDGFLWNRMEDFSTLILGETGTGKGAAAAAIGRSGFIPFDPKTNKFSDSFTRTFIAINLSQYPESLIESELFGHRKGAFTGAIDAHAGVFARCSPYGSILLDEIGEISYSMQIKLLQILQERTFCPVGSHEKQRFEGRVIAATNRSMTELRQTQLFRDDFYYRLCSDILIVPTLRQRVMEDQGEIDILLAHAIQRLIGKDDAGLTQFVKEKLAQSLPPDYSWPGNVRELEQCIRSILIKGVYHAEGKNKTADMEADIIEHIRNKTYDADSLITDYCTLLYKKNGSYEEVARRMKMDRRTIKKYISMKNNQCTTPPAKRVLADH
ncbi:MAG TPA: sigma 54-interacting transcriptional regulator [Smithella sp.]|nr:sigma 54-interacting transcriptional regulator [Smithella sp.]